MRLVTAGEMQGMDRQTIQSFGLPGRVLMENAGRGATRFLLDHFRAIPITTIGIIAGRGNNGGDGFVIAIRDLLRAIAQQQAATPDFLDGLRAQEVVAAAQASAAGLSWQKVERCLEGGGRG